MVKLLFPGPDFIFETQTAIQREYIRRIREQGIDAAIEWLLPVKGSEERSYPETLTLRWESDGSAEYTVTLAEGINGPGTTYRTDKTELAVTNLKVGQDYTVWINGSAAGRFTTADSRYRFIRIDGVLNVRDIGGIAIRQGLVYRGTDIRIQLFDKWVEITEQGKRTFAEELGIRSELNLRRCIGEVRVNPFTDGSVTEYHIPYRPYLETFEEPNRKALCEIFELLSHEEVYPVFVHCAGGADRTAMIALFLRAICGEDDEDILIDYELTSLSTYAGGAPEGVHEDGIRRRTTPAMAKFLARITSYGETGEWKSGVRGYLLSCGIPEETIDRVRGILTGNTAAPAAL